MMNFDSNLHCNSYLLITTALLTIDRPTMMIENLNGSKEIFVIIIFVPEFVWKVVKWFI